MSVTTSGGAAVVTAEKRAIKGPHSAEAKETDHYRSFKSQFTRIGAKSSRFLAQNREEICKHLVKKFHVPPPAKNGGRPAVF